jgi:hypothetical protein
MDRAADSDPQLMGVHHAGELTSGLLPRRRQRQEVPVLREYDAPEGRRSLQEELVVTIGRAVRFRCQHIDATLLRADRDRPWHVVVEIQPEAYGRPARFSFSRSRDGRCSLAMWSTSVSCWAMAVSRVSRWSW